MVCIDARQAHAVLSQMHNKTDENDAAMLSELARTGFYKKIEVKCRLAQERRALLRAREVAIKMRMNTENTIRGLLASFGIRLPKHLQTYEQRVRKILEGQSVLAGALCSPSGAAGLDIVDAGATLDHSDHCDRHAACGDGTIPVHLASELYACCRRDYCGPDGAGSLGCCLGLYAAECRDVATSYSD